MKLGLTTGVYLNYPIPEIINRLARFGYAGVDFWCGRPQIYRDDYSEQELKAFRQQVEDLGMEVPSLLPAFYRYPHCLSSPNRKIRQDSVLYMKMCIDNAVLLGAPVVLVVPEASMFGQPVEEAWAYLLESVDEVCNYARQYPLKLGIEAINHFVSDMVNTAADARRLIAALGHDNLGIVLDTGHIALSDEPAAEAIKIAGDRLLQVHINDNDGVNQQNLVPGEGSFDFAGMIESLAAAGFDGYLSAELAYHYTFDPDPAVHDNYVYLKELLQ